MMGSEYRLSLSLCLSLSQCGAAALFSDLFVGLRRRASGRGRRTRLALLFVMAVWLPYALERATEQQRRPWLRTAARRAKRALALATLGVQLGAAHGLIGAAESPTALALTLPLRRATPDEEGTVRGVVALLQVSSGLLGKGG